MFEDTCKMIKSDKLYKPSELKCSFYSNLLCMFVVHLLDIEFIWFTTLNGMNDRFHFDKPFDGNELVRREVDIEMISNVLCMLKKIKSKVDCFGFSWWNSMGLQQDRCITSRSHQLFVWNHHIHTVGSFRFRLIQIDVYIYIYLYVYIYMIIIYV